MPPNIMARSVLVATILLLLLGVPVEAAKRGRKDNAVRQGGVKSNHQTEAVALVPLRARGTGQATQRRRRWVARLSPSAGPAACLCNEPAYASLPARACACASLRLRDEPACAATLSVGPVACLCNEPACASLPAQQPCLRCATSLPTQACLLEPALRYEPVCASQLEPMRERAASFPCATSSSSPDRAREPASAASLHVQ